MGVQHYDLAVVGGGPGGYVAAIRAAQLGMKVVCVDDRKHLGGTCLNIGCIPSKALLNSTEKFREAKESFSSLGVAVQKLQLDLDAMMKQKEKAVTTLTGGINHLFRNHKITHIQGKGQLGGNRQIVIQSANQDQDSLRADHIVIATGSLPVSLNRINIDEKRICTSEGILSLPEVPKHLIVIGGGYIGLEMGSVWGRLGSQITCVELTDRIIPTMDKELASHFQKILEKQGFRFRLNAKVTEGHTEDQTVKLHVSSPDHADKDAEEISGSHVLVAVGRRPFTDGLGLERAGVEVTGQGFISVDKRFRTSAEGIYAIGDVAGEPMLAHKAQDEGLACVEAIGGGNGYVNYDTIPAVIYTSPEVASVGKTEEELKEKGRNYRVGKFPFRANSRAWCVGKAKEGFVKILADAENDLILGGHIVGPDAGTLIHEIVTTMEFGASAEELGRTSHGHPTFNEAVREAALAVHERSIHQ